MRQVGYLAAAGLYALENNINRLTEDHKRAKEIGEVLSQQSYIKSVEPIETNIIIFELHANVDEALFITELAKNDVKLIGMGSGKLRLVTHLDYTSEMHSKFLNIISNLNI